MRNDTSLSDRLLELVALISKEQEEKKKLQELQQEVEAMEKENKELKDKLKSYEDLIKKLQADFQNYRKRMENIRQEEYDKGLQKIVTDILPVLDNFQQALKSLEGYKDEIKNLPSFVQSFIEGIRMIEKIFNEVLTRNNVEPIKSVGEVFDPTVHEAVGTKDSPEYDVPTVIEEWQKGYKYKGKLLRLAKVVVAKPVKPKASDDTKPSKES